MRVRNFLDVVREFMLTMPFVDADSLNLRKNAPIGEKYLDKIDYITIC